MSDREPFGWPSFIYGGTVTGRNPKPIGADGSEAIRPLEGHKPTSTPKRVLGSARIEYGTGQTETDFYGGIPSGEVYLTGRVTTSPEPQSWMEKLAARDQMSRVVEVDYAKIEKRILAIFAEQVAPLIVELAFELVQEQADEEGCGAVIAALRFTGD